MSSINPYTSPSDATFEVQNVRWPIEVPGQLSRDDFVDSTKAFAAYQARVLFRLTFILAAFLLPLKFFKSGEIDFVMISVVAVLCCICPAR